MDVADQTRQTISAALRKFEPPAPIQLEELPLAVTQRSVIVLTASKSEDGIPYTYDERIATTTSLMPQEKYQRLLVARIPATRRWENAPTEGVSLADLDHEEILRTARIGMQAGRLPETTGSDVEDILERLGLMADGRLLNAAIALFGKRLVPDYPQCQLRMARFKGSSKAEFLDNRQVFGHGFGLLDEAMTSFSGTCRLRAAWRPARWRGLTSRCFPLRRCGRRWSMRCAIAITAWPTAQSTWPSMTIG
jgi:ATP-dependent DNA helicase RecG